ncbi:MAG: hypothetical protein AAF384_02460 [Pseudomonadota bacterium]
MIPEIHLVMHGVAIKKHADPSAIASTVGLAPDTVATVLAGAQDSGRVVAADDKFMLSPAGRMILEGEYSRFYGDTRANHAFVSAYESFEQVNLTLKQLITDWQTKEVAGQRVSNDHGDADYDESVINRLGDLHERFEPVLAQLAAGVTRLKIYGDKLSSALDKAEDGETEWVSDAKVESYHTVWFEMHEDLLRIMGREREE